MTEDLPTKRALELRAVSKTFGGKRVLCDLNLVVESGEVHAIVGHNGSGKSTLVKILAGYHPPDPGSEARSRGMRFRLGDARKVESLGVRFVHQDLALVGSFTAVDNVYLAQRYPKARGGQVNWREARRVTRQLLDSLGHDIDVTVPVAELSAIERTAVAVARAIRPRGEPTHLLVLDEPTAALPHDQAQGLIDLMKILQGRGVAVIFISHHLNEVMCVADNVTVLRDGSPIGTYRCREITEGALAESMTGHRHVRVPTQRIETDRSQTALRINGLTARSIRRFDLSVQRGEIVGVTGVSGSGRDELALAIFGGGARGGEVSVNGTPIPPGRPDLSVKAGMGHLPAERASHALFSTMTILENICVVGLPLGRGRKVKVHSRAERAEALHWMKELDVRPLSLRRSVDTLSGGNQQKLMLARWLRSPLRALILDEPTQGVDVIAREQVHAWIRRMAEKGLAVLVSSSDSEELALLCHRVVILAKGRIACELSQSELSRHAIETQMVMT